MATIKLNPLQKEMLGSFRYTRRMIGRYSVTINVLLEVGFVFRSWYEYDYSEYAITPAGLAYLYQDAPMVDQPQPIDDNDDLPFSDLGEPDDEDTQELPAITVDAPKPTLSNLIDAALNPDDTDAYTALKSYDWASVPLWVAEIEYDDVNTYMWAMWAEAKTDVSKRPHAERAANIRHLLQEVTDPREVVE